MVESRMIRKAINKKDNDDELKDENIIEDEYTDINNENKEIVLGKGCAFVAVDEISDTNVLCTAWTSVIDDCSKDGDKDNKDNDKDGDKDEDGDKDKDKDCDKEKTKHKDNRITASTIIIATTVTNVPISNGDTVLNISAAAGNNVDAIDAVDTTDTIDAAVNNDNNNTNYKVDDMLNHMLNRQQQEEIEHDNRNSNSNRTTTATTITAIPIVTTRDDDDDNEDDILNTNSNNSINANNNNTSKNKEDDTLPIKQQ